MTISSSFFTFLEQWSTFDGNEGDEYLFVNIKMTIQDARSFCEDRTGKLFEPKDINTAKNVISLANIYSRY